MGSIRKDSESWPVSSLGLVGRGSMVVVASIREATSFFLAVPAMQMGLESLPECAVGSSDELSGLVTPWEAGEL